ncbi:hypothetical protein IscW_ISCW002526, partial [Ixodes scapularis]
RRQRSSKKRQSHSKERERERSPLTTRRKNRSVSFPRLPGSGNHKSRAENRENPRLSRQDSHTHRDQSQASTPTRARDVGRPTREDQTNDHRSDGGSASPPKRT